MRRALLFIFAALLAGCGDGPVMSDGGTGTTSDAGPMVPSVVIEGTGALLDLHVVNDASALVVTDTEVTRFSIATGMVEATLLPTQPILDSVYGDGGLVLTHAETLTRWTSDLMPSAPWAEVAIAMPCVGASIVGGDRLLCFRGVRDREWSLYYLATGDLLNTGMASGPSLVLSTWAHPIPGWDGTVVMDENMAWIPMSFMMVEEDNSLSAIRASMDALAAPGPISFRGSPAREMIAADGRRRDVGPCLDRTETLGCIHDLEPLPTLRSGTQFLASDPTTTEALFVVEGVPGSGCIATPCHAQRVVIPSGIAEETEFVLPSTEVLWPVVRAVGDGTSMLMVGRTGCVAGACTGYRVHRVAL